MELIGIALSVPVAFVANLVYCFLLVKVVARRARLRRALWLASTAVLFAFSIELILLIAIGAIRSRAVLGVGFYVGHTALFFLGPPALANVLILSSAAGVRRWYWAVPVCTLFAFGLVLLQYGVSEALYGVDGMGGPYSNRRSDGFNAYMVDAMLRRVAPEYISNRMHL